MIKVYATFFEQFSLNFAATSPTEVHVWDFLLQQDLSCFKYVKNLKTSQLLKMYCHQ